MINYSFKTIKEQVELLKKRGMKIENQEKAEEVLSFINYYKIKEFTLSFYDKEKEMYTKNISFDEILTKFYENKNLRMDLLRLTEKIELSLKTKISYILGEKLGALGYLKFNNWCNKEKFDKFFLIEKEKEVLNRIEKAFNKDKNIIMNDFKTYDTLPVWIAFNLLTFGEILNVFKLMNKKDKKNIATKHNASLENYLSWLEAINLIRNLSAHNYNIVDFEFKTKPKINKFKDKLHLYNGKPTNKIAGVILILEYLVYSINKNYCGGSVKKRLKKLCKNRTDEEAQYLGFKNFEIIEKLKI